MVASRCGLAQTRRTGRPDLADRGMSVHRYAAMRDGGMCLALLNQSGRGR